MLKCIWSLHRTSATTGCLTYTPSQTSPEHHRTLVSLPTRPRHCAQPGRGPTPISPTYPTHPRKPHLDTNRAGSAMKPPTHTSMYCPLPIPSYLMPCITSPRAHTPPTEESCQASTTCRPYAEQSKTLSPPSPNPTPLTYSSGYSLDPSVKNYSCFNPTEIST